MSGRRGRPVERGLALVEVLLAVVICAVGLVVAAQGVALALRLELSAANRECAAQLANRLLGELESGARALADARGDFAAEGKPGIDWRIEVRTTDIEGLREARITVTWEERRDVRAFELTRLFFSDPKASLTSEGGE